MHKILFLGRGSLCFWRSLPFWGGIFGFCNQIPFLVDHLVYLKFVARSLPWIRPLNKSITRSRSMSIVASHGLSFGNTLVQGPYPMCTTLQSFSLCILRHLPHTKDLFVNWSTLPLIKCECTISVGGFSWTGPIINWFFQWELVILVYVRIKSGESPKVSYGPIFDNGGWLWDGPLGPIL